jgi:hypothetical protein
MIIAGRPRFALADFPWGEIMNEVLSALEWQHTVPMVILVLGLFFFCIFKESIAQKIGEIQVLRGEGKKWEALFSRPPEKASYPPAGSGDTVITEEDVRRAFGRIPDLAEADIGRYLKCVRDSLVRQGVVTNGQLDSLVSSHEVLDTLRRVYVEELLRPPEAPLDPVGVAVWGPPLVKYGVGQDMVEGLRRRIRESPEYRQKHRG